MGLPRVSIKHPVATFMAMLVCIVLGTVSLISSPMELMPKISPPIAVVMATLPGASPQEVATMVTAPLESAVATVAGIQSISSTSRENTSIITLQFSWGTNMSEARVDLQERLDRVRLPEGVQRPSLLKFDPNMLPVMELAATSDQDLIDLKTMLEAEVKPRLERMNGVAAVSITGAPEREIQVLLDQERLRQYGLTQGQISAVIQASNLTYPAGKVGLDDKSLSLRVLGKLGTVEELASLVVTVVRDPAGEPLPPAGPPVAGGQIPMRAIRLADVAEVKVVLPRPRSLTPPTAGRASVCPFRRKEMPTPLPWPGRSPANWTGSRKTTPTLICALSWTRVTSSSGR